MTHYYSPHTGEHIATDTPADWMSATDIAPPAYNATQSAVFVNGAWTVVSTQPPEVQVPTSLTMRQARLALLGAGLLDTVQAGVLAMPQAAQIEWEFATTVERTSPLVATLTASLGLDDAALDALFESGAAL